MKAVILAAGKGTRMRELTNELPKPMLPVQGRPILEHIVAGIVAAGMREVFVITGWRAEVSSPTAIGATCSLVSPRAYMRVRWRWGECASSVNSRRRL